MSRSHRLIQRPNLPVTPADPAHRSVGPRQLPVVQDSAFQTIARSIEQLQELQKEALKSAAPAHVPSGGSSPSQVEQLKPGTSELPTVASGFRGRDAFVVWGVASGVELYPGGCFGDVFRMVVGSASVCW